MYDKRAKDRADQLAAQQALKAMERLCKKLYPPKDLKAKSSQKQ